MVNEQIGFGLYTCETCGKTTPNRDCGCDECGYRLPVTGTVMSLLKNGKTELVFGAFVKILRGSDVIGSAASNVEGQFRFDVVKGDYTIVAESPPLHVPAMMHIVVCDQPIYNLPLIMVSLLGETEKNVVVIKKIIEERIREVAKVKPDSLPWDDPNDLFPHPWKPRPKPWEREYPKKRTNVQSVLWVGGRRDHDDFTVTCKESSKDIFRSAVAMVASASKNSHLLR